MPFMLYGVTTWGNDVLSTVLGRQPDILMMRALLGENAPDIGYYDTSARLALMTEYIFLFGLGGTLVSVFSELAHTDERAYEETPHKNNLSPPLTKYPRLLKARRDIAGYQTVATAPIFAFMLVFAPIVIEVVYGAKFAGAVPMMIASLILQALTVIAFGGGMHVTSLVVIGKERVVFVNRLSWGVLNLVANYFLIQKYGGLGAMIGTQTANCGVCVTESILTARWIGQSFQLTRTASILAVVTTSVLITYFSINLLGGQIPVLLRLIIAGILMALITGGGYTIFKIPEARKAFEKIRSLFANSKDGTPDAVSLTP
jgi:O-antigen/teichoic acid export membrane protein